MAFQLFLILFLIALSAFFVATEFSMIRIRPSRVDQLVMEGRKNALAVRKVINNLDGYLSSCQLGITMTSLVLGWLGEPTVERLLHPLFAWLGLNAAITSVLSFLIAFGVVTYFHVVLGELAPKTVAIQKAETVAFLTAKPIIWFTKIAFPFIWLLNHSAIVFVSMFGLKPVKDGEEAHSEEEIRIILTDSFESGKINKTEYGYVSNIFNFDELHAKEIMVPRTDMVCLYLDKPLGENLQIILEEQYTRFPVARGSKDDIAGIINTKQLFLTLQRQPDADWTSLVQPAMTVSDATPVKKLLKMMQQARVHMAILVDEYGGTSGLITIEDIIEEIVGEIRDEFDVNERKPIEQIGEGHYIVDGTVLLSDVSYLMGVDLDDEDIDTIGGWVYNLNPELDVGETFTVEHMEITLLEKDHHRVRRVELKHASREDAPSPGDRHEAY